MESTHQPSAAKHDDRGSIVYDTVDNPIRHLEEQNNSRVGFERQAMYATGRGQIFISDQIVQARTYRSLSSFRSQDYIMIQVDQSIQSGGQHFIVWPAHDSPKGVLFTGEGIFECAGEVTKAKKRQAAAPPPQFVDGTVTNGPIMGSSTNGGSGTTTNNGVMYNSG
jgi:hypothetical protein